MGGSPRGATPGEDDGKLQKIRLLWRKWLSSPIFKNIVALRLPQRHMGDSQIGLCQTKRTPDLLQGMQYTYLSTMLSTLEKKFGIKSKETVRRSLWWKNNGGWSLHLQAYLMSGNEIAQILFLFFLPITVKVGYTHCWHIQLSRLCLHFRTQQMFWGICSHRQRKGRYGVELDWPLQGVFPHQIMGLLDLCKWSKWISSFNKNS